MNAALLKTVQARECLKLSGISGVGRKPASGFAFDFLGSFLKENRPKGSKTKPADGARPKFLLAAMNIFQLE
jgi:hypothetical protein